MVAYMFVDDSTIKVKEKVYRRVLLRNSYRVNGVVKHDTIANLSRCSDEDIDHLKKCLKTGKGVEDVSMSSFKLKQGLSVGAVWTLDQMAKRIGIQESLGNSRYGKLVSWMIYARLLGCGSRLSATRLMSQHAGCDILDLDSFSEDDLYEAMDWIEKEQPRIELELFQKKYGETIPTFYLYDVTSSYLEGTENELGEFGYNRDGKQGKKQIVIGLMADADGWPIAIEVFKGNTNDTKTVKSQILKLTNRFGVKEVTFVGDRGMIKRAQIEDLHDENFHYITSITKPEIERLVKENTIPLTLFDVKIAEIEKDGVRYIFRKNPERAKEIADTRQGKLTRLQAFCNEKNTYLKAHPKAKTETAENAVKKKAADLKIIEWVQIVLNERSLQIQVDEEKRKEEARLDGCYVLKTDREKEGLSTKQAHDKYKNLADVEWAFRTMKTTLLEMRGIFVRKSSRTRAHVFIVMLSYMIAYRLRRYWQELEMTVEEGIRELGSIHAIELHSPQLSYQKIPEPRKAGLLLLEKAGVSLPDAISCKGATGLTNKKLISERKKLIPRSL